MNSNVRQAWLGYVVAVASVALMTAIRWVLLTVYETQIPLALFYLTILVTAWYGGYKPAWLALVLGLIPMTYFRLSGMVHELHWQASTAVYLFVGSTFILLIKGQFLAREAAEKRTLEAMETQRMLEEEIAEREIIEGDLRAKQEQLRASTESLRANQALLKNLIEVQEKEKQWVCYEFHDGLMQYAAGALMLLESSTGNGLSSDGMMPIDEAIASLRMAVEDGRRVMRGIHPTVLDDMGIEAALDDLSDQMSGSNLRVVFDQTGQIGRLPKPLEATVYRVVQEAVNNAKKYSGSEQITVELRRTDGELHLEIRDRGCGFDVESARKGGFGLLGMTERVRLLGGECSIISVRDSGTRVIARLPMPSAESSDWDGARAD